MLQPVSDDTITAAFLKSVHADAMTDLPPGIQESVNDLRSDMLAVLASVRRLGFVIAQESPNEQERADDAQA